MDIPVDAAYVEEDALPSDPDTAAAVDSSEDKPRRGRRRTAPKEPPPPVKARRITAADKLLADQLADGFTEVAVAAALFTPTGSKVLIARAEITSRALVAMSVDNPRLRRTLEKVAQVGPFGNVARTGVEFAIAVQMDMHIMPPDAVLGQITGVTEKYYEAHAAMAPQAAAAWGPPPPPGWGPDGPGPVRN